MSARLYAIASGLAAGVFVAEATNLTVIAVLAPLAAGALIAACVVAGRNAVAALALVVVASASFGAALAGLRLAAVDRGALARAAARGADALVEGRVAEVPRSRDGVLRFAMNVRDATIDGRAVRVRENVLVSMRPPPAQQLGHGDRVRIDVRLGPLATPAEPQRPPADDMGAAASRDARAEAAARRLRWSGIGAGAYARPDGIERLGGPSAPLDVIGRVGRDAVARPILRLPPREAGLLLGIAVGDSSRLDPGVEADFRTTGLTHLLAVSGGNLALFLGSIAFLLRALRAGRRTQLAVLGVALVSFMAITRFEPSVLRAGLMGGVGLAGVALGARREALDALAVAAIVLLVADPFIVRSVGFQLSALATFGILVLGPRLRAALPGKLGAAASVTLAAQLVVAPLVALVFHSVSIVALVSNVVVMPAVGPATILALISAPLRAIHPWLGLACVTLARPFLWWMTGAASLFARIPNASVRTPAGLAGGAIVVVLVVLAVVAARVRRPPRVVTVAVAFGVFVASSVWSAALVAPVPDGLQVVALDVGQGDAILVRAGGATMLVDGGPDPVVLLRRLVAHRVKRVDLLVLTHPHADHVAGFTGVLARMRVGHALDPGLDAELPAYTEYAREIAGKRIPRTLARAGQRYTLGPAVVHVVAPAEPLFAGTPSDLNNNSVVMRVTYGAASVLLGGELQEEGQQRMLDGRVELRSTVFKVPHHGSVRFLRSFYEATRASLAVIPVGPNDYGQPSEAALDALEALGIRTYRTDRSGDVDVVLDEHGSFRVRAA